MAKIRLMEIIDLFFVCKGFASCDFATLRDDALSVTTPLKSHRPIFAPNKFYVFCGKELLEGVCAKGS